MKNFSLIDLDQLSEAELKSIIDMAGKIKANPADYMECCHGKIMATLFYEPSTRTQMSFQAAMMRLGGKVIGFSDPGSSSVSKGETLKDTVRIVSAYADIVVIRHPKEGAAYAASLYSRKPVINAGDGGHLHPTQTLADLVTLSQEKGTLSGLTIGISGDMRLPIQYALTYPDRIHLNEDRLDLFKQPLEFFEPDLDKFRCLALAFEAIKKGGNMPCIVNAANEIVNRGFLEDKCGFTQMSDIIEKTMSRVSFSSAPDYDTYVSTDAEARRVATELLGAH